MKEQLLVGLIHSTGDICVVTDAGRNITMMNPAVLYRTGYSEEELMGKKDSFLFPKDWRASYTSHVFKSLPEKGKWIGKLSIQTKNGDVLPLQGIVRAMFDGANKFSGSIIIAHSPTQEWLENQSAWKSEGFLQKLFQTMNDGVVVLDETLKVMMNNAAFNRMLGCVGDECFEAQMKNSWIDPAEQKRLRQALTITQNEGTFTNFLLTCKKKDHSRIILSCTFAKLEKGPDPQLKYVATFRDVTNVHYSEELTKNRDRMELLISEIQRKTAMLDVLNELHRLVLRNAGVDKIFKTSIEGIAKIVEHDLAGIYVYDQSGKQFLPDTMSKQTDFSQKLARFPLTLGEGIIGNAAISGNAVLINNAQNDPRSKYPPEMKPALEHFIAAPMKAKDTLYGVLVIARNRDPGFIEEEAQLLKSFADATTIALENIRVLNPQALDKSIQSNSLPRGKRKSL